MVAHVVQHDAADIVQGVHVSVVPLHVRVQQPKRVEGQVLHEHGETVIGRFAVR